MSRATQGQLRVKRPPKSKLRLHTGCHSAPGRQREHNEDACALPTPGVDEERFGTLLVVADGVGGLPGGATASQQAVQDLQALYYAGFGPTEPADRLRQCVQAVNAINRLQPHKPDGTDGYLTTLVAAVVQGDQIWVANVGDSRAYLIKHRPRRRLQLTEDHSRETQLAKRAPTKEPAPSGQEGIITRAIGLEDRCQVDTYHYTWSPRDRLVLCSDGLAQLPEREMVDLTLGTRAEAVAKRLVDRAIEVDGSDNCTAIVAAWEVSSPPQSRPAPKARSGRVPRRASSASAWKGSRIALLLGLLLGWLSAAIIVVIWLDAAGIVDIF